MMLLIEKMLAPLVLAVRMQKAAKTVSRKRWKNVDKPRELNGHGDSLGVGRRVWPSARNGSLEGYEY